jgi:hypothetical protein
MNVCSCWKQNEIRVLEEKFILQNAPTTAGSKMRSVYWKIIWLKLWRAAMAALLAC